MKPRENAVAVVRTLRDAGHVAYFAGGCVRDALLGLVPKDYDVATDAPPPRVRELFRNTQAVGAAFGVILVRVGGSMIEVATFRSDGDYSDGRRPESVTFATAEADAQRRDFTINGLFYDPDADHVIDYVGGQADLAAKVLRAIGDPAARFAEDHLRLLRAVRFAARFGLTIEPATAAAIDAAAPLLPRISAERIAEELRRMLTGPTRNAAFGLLHRFSLVEVLLPDVPGDRPPPLRPGQSLFLNLPAVEAIDFSLAWLCVLLDLQTSRGGGLPSADAFTPPAGRALVGRSRRTLRPSNEQLDAIGGIVAQVHAVLQPAPDDATLKRFLARPTATAALQLLESLAAVGVALDAITSLRPRLERLSLGEVAPLPLLSGDDLIAAGVTPGPAFKGVLNAVYDAQLNGKITDAAAALALGRRLIAEG